VLEMKALASYQDHLLNLLATAAGGTKAHRTEIRAALDGEPGRALRRLVPLEELRKSGAFFTSRRLAKYALRPLIPGLSENSRILDPACGVGDLLIYCATHLQIPGNFRERVEAKGQCLFGLDIHSEFVDIARARLLLSEINSFSGPRVGLDSGGDLVHSFSQLKEGDCFDGAEVIRQATHILLNPPYSSAEAPEFCTWASGSVSKAALILEFCLRQASRGSRLIAILPDVLRSGTRYQKWRDMVASRSIINRAAIYGRFDHSADVDVFVLDLTVDSNSRSIREPAGWGHPKKRSRKRLGDLFDVRVGPVVDYRDPHEGPWYPFLKSRGLPAWVELGAPVERRRFKGQAFRPPFVVIRRTSRPGDRTRATGTIIIGSEPVAIENHLIVLIPRDGTLETCRNILEILRQPSTTRWLNTRICCRHLTVKSLGDLPYQGF
jgi:SAM-dependent methyltransferase